MARKWTESYMRDRWPAEVREKLLEQGLDPQEKPTHEWLREHGYRQFLRRARELGYTPDDFLLEECGFEPRSKDWPCGDAEVIAQVEDWIEYNDEVWERINNGSIDNARTHLRKIMELSQECNGTANLLKYGRGDEQVCVRRAKRLMRKLKKEVPNSGTRSNYVTTFRDFLGDKHDDGIVEYDPITPLVARAEWTHEPEQPEYVPTPSQIRICFEACETLTEQILILSLAGHGMRTSSLTGDDNQDAYRLDAPIPHREYSADRKNGVGVSPLVVGVDLLEEYFDRLAADPEYNGEILPSDDSEDGARSDEWVRKKVSDIADRADVTLANGEDLKPSHCRQFWYTYYSEAYSEWKEKMDDVAALRGASSGEVVWESYIERGTALQHFLNYMQPILQTAFPEQIEPADDLGDVDVNPDQMSSGQQQLADFVAESESHTDSIKSPSVVAIDAYFAACNQIGNRLSTLWSKIVGVDVWATIAQTRTRTVTFGVSLVLVLSVALSFALVEAGIYLSPIGGEMTVSQAGVALMIGVYYHRQLNVTESSIY